MYIKDLFDPKVSEIIADIDKGNFEYTNQEMEILSELDEIEDFESEIVYWDSDL
jgi:hypothetical protein